MNSFFSFVEILILNIAIMLLEIFKWMDLALNYVEHYATQLPANLEHKPSSESPHRQSTYHHSRTQNICWLNNKTKSEKRN